MHANLFLDVPWGAEDETLQYAVYTRYGIKLIINLFAFLLNNIHLFFKRYPSLRCRGENRIKLEVIIGEYFSGFFSQHYGLRITFHWNLVNDIVICYGSEKKILFFVIPTSKFVIINNHHSLLTFILHFFTVIELHWSIIHCIQSVLWGCTLLHLQLPLTRKITTLFHIASSI